jgi:hypothetical protein
MWTAVSRTNPRGSPRARLISSLAILVVVAGGAWFYSIRKTDELMAIGVNDHLRCAIAGTYPRQTQKAEMLAGVGEPFGPLVESLLEAATGSDYTVAAAHTCTAAGRADANVILRKGQTLISVILARRADQDVFPATARAVYAAGIPLHEGFRDGYSVACFESGGYLGYVVSALPGQQNSDLAARLAPVISRFTKG